MSVRRAWRHFDEEAIDRALSGAKKPDLRRAPNARKLMGSRARKAETYRCAIRNKAFKRDIYKPVSTGEWVEIT